ncbi:MAG: NUDIX hydrolase [Chromatiales bacterium]|nr:NUDIX hydrolase [Chromatiales bacterium]
MKFCSQCAGVVSRRVPPGDNLPRWVCDNCGAIHYENPKIVAGCLPRWEGRILLCRRAIEPRYGKWTVPAGFMENGETLAEAAARETLEEAMARVQIDRLYSVISIPYISQVYMLFLGDLLAPEFGPGDESLEVRLFKQGEIPWEDLAFPSVTMALRWYYEDLDSGEFPLHTVDFERRPG